jgi:hypothetical protein
MSGDLAAIQEMNSSQAMASARSKIALFQRAINNVQHSITPRGEIRVVCHHEECFLSLAGEA